MNRSISSAWRAAAARVYRGLGRLYPVHFRQQFEEEMRQVFEEALADQKPGALATLRFFAKEVIETVACAFEQHLQAGSFWTRPIPANLLAFLLGYCALAAYDLANEVFNIPDQTIFPWYLLANLLVGALGGFAIALAGASRHKGRFALLGGVGFALASYLSIQIFRHYFPHGFQETGEGLAFFTPFLVPALTGTIFGLFLGAATASPRRALAIIGATALILTIGFIANRVSAALLQSFALPAIAAMPGLFLYFIAPRVFEGALVGLLFGRLSTTRHLQTA